MARAYSQDLRDRVIDAALAGTPARHTIVAYALISGRAADRRLRRKMR
jgi:hypothetical protein